MRSLSTKSNLRRSLYPQVFSILWICILVIACDDEKRSTSEEVIAGMMMIDQGVATPDQDFPADMAQGEDADLPVDADIPDMMWTYDLEVIEEEYVDRASPVDRLQAGYAERSLGFPLGMATVGYFPPSGGFTNPYALSGTDTQHTSLTARALLLRQGEQSLILLRVDTVAMWQDFIVDVKRALRARGRGDLADGLIIGATHTHASGGKIINHNILRILAGEFSPALYYRVLDNVIAVIFDAEERIQPASAGYDTLQVSTLHSDRRCENGDVIDHSMGVLKVVDDQDQPLAILINYAMHGTVFGADEFLLSADATGAVERGIEQHLPRYAPVLYFQSWAGDMSPATPHEHLTAEGFEQRDKYRDLGAIAKGAAEAVIPALETISTSPDLMLNVKTLRFPMNNELINPDGSFDHYPHGGAYCYPLGGDNCPEEGVEQRVYDASELTCLFGVPEEDGITWGHITAAQIGDLGLVTLPGEPLTSIGTELRDRARALTGLEQVWVLGYSQGYLGYLLHSYDYLLGGYEGAGGIWGPGLGEFLVNRGVEIMGHMMDTTRPLSFRPIPLPAASDIPREALVIEEAQGEVSWTQEPQRSEQGVWSAEWIGGPPAVDTPRVTLEQAIQVEVEGGGTEEAWLPVTHLSGVEWSSDGLELEVSLRVDPTYRDVPDQVGRSFYWRVSLPELFSTMPSNGDLTGRFRWVVKGQRAEPYELISTPFEFTP